MEKFIRLGSRYLLEHETHMENFGNKYVSSLWPVDSILSESRKNLAKVQKKFKKHAKALLTKEFPVKMAQIIFNKAMKHARKDYIRDPSFCEINYMSFALQNYYELARTIKNCDT